MWKKFSSSVKIMIFTLSLMRSMLCLSLETPPSPALESYCLHSVNVYMAFGVSPRICQCQGFDLESSSPVRLVELSRNPLIPLENQSVKDCVLRRAYFHGVSGHTTRALIDVLSDQAFMSLYLGQLRERLGAACGLVVRTMDYLGARYIQVRQEFLAPQMF